MHRREFFRRALRGSRGPLEGIRVLDVTKVWAGPMAGAVLGDLGADVVRVELPGRPDGPATPRIPGTGLSWFRESVHRNKRSVGLDLRTVDGRDRFLRLVAGADIVVENYRPGTLDGWGVGYEDCRAARLDVVFVSISGYGQYGPDAHRPAYDPVIQAATGLMALNGRPGDPPLRLPTFVADDVAALHAVIGAMAALHHRNRTGEGQHVDVAMADCVMAFSSGLPTLAAAGHEPARYGNETDFVVPSNVYPCRDGHLYLTVALDRHWRDLVDVLGRPDLATAPGFGRAAERVDNRVEVNRVVEQWTSGLAVAVAVARLAERGLVVSPVSSLRDAVATPQVAARGTLLEVVLSNGTVARLVGPPVKFSRTPTAIRRPAPVAGADTVEVFDELGNGAAEHEKNRLRRIS